MKIHHSILDRSKRSRLGRGAAAFALAGVLALSAAPARAEDNVANAGWQAGAMVSTLVYGPVKLCYALLGSVVSGFAWVLTGGNNDVARPILASSVYGDYVVTPAKLQGEEPLHFVGRDDEAASTAAGDGIPDTDVSADAY